MRSQGSLEEKWGVQIKWAKTPRVEQMDFITDWDLVNGSADSQQCWCSFSSGCRVCTKNSNAAAGEPRITMREDFCLLKQRSVILKPSVLKGDTFSKPVTNYPFHDPLWLSNDYFLKESMSDLVGKMIMFSQSKCNKLLIVSHQRSKIQRLSMYDHKRPRKRVYFPTWKAGTSIFFGTFA